MSHRDWIASRPQVRSRERKNAGKMRGNEARDTGSSGHISGHITGSGVTGTRAWNPVQARKQNWVSEDRAHRGTDVHRCMPCPSGLGFPSVSEVWDPNSPQVPTSTKSLSPDQLSPAQVGAAVQALWSLFPTWAWPFIVMIKELSLPPALTLAPACGSLECGVGGSPPASRSFL